MTDKELLELASKAVDIERQFNTKIQSWIWYQHSDDPTERGRLLDWNPLTDDGDALRLAVKLHIWIDTGSSELDASTYARAEPDIDVFVNHNGDPYAATRRAIVRAAAEITRQRKIDDKFM